MAPYLPPGSNLLHRIARRVGVSIAWVIREIFRLDSRETPPELRPTNQSGSGSSDPRYFPHSSYVRSVRTAEESRYQRLLVLDKDFREAVVTQSYIDGVTTFFIVASFSLAFLAFGIFAVFAIAVLR